MDPPSADAFTIGLLYVKTLEMMAIGAMLDDRYKSIPVAYGDVNEYTLGRIGVHNVVIVGPARGEQGTVATAQFVTTIRLTFPNVTIGLLIGIGGGIPRPPKYAVRLGDVVVGAPEEGPAVIQYDLGKRTVDGFEVTRSVAGPPALLRKVVNKIIGAMSWQTEEHDILKPHLDRFSLYPRLSREYQRPSVPDRLFQSTFLHKESTECASHDEQFEQVRPLPNSEHIGIHYGTILSGNTLMKSSEDRDLLSQKHKDALCFEMEAAGLMDVFPCLVIRGISDYSDSHKNDAWQNYAAATAAAYAREFLLNMSEQTPRAPELSKLAKDSSSALTDAEKSHERSVFSNSSNNSGVQVVHYTGSMKNIFGMR
ncbi:hypothetical protein N0V90_007530 [Kalmusia sp. IMI 367209]|nr:hypothetical protein N0V90_007530 [Kalmusia sp. IMI 367209]